MTRNSPSAEELLREMRSSVLPVDSPEAAADRRSHTISHLRAVQEKVLLDRKSTRLRRRTAGAVAVLAAMAAGFVFYVGQRDRRIVENTMPAQTIVRALDGRIAVVHGGEETQHGAGVGMPLEAGDTIRTAEFRALLTLPSRAAVEVSPSTNLGLGAPERPQAEWLELKMGRLDVEVPKLNAGRTLSVHTPHATVTVHGTRFSVIVAASAGNTLQTTVDVREGSVKVEYDGRTSELGSGNVWSSGTASASPQRSVAHPDPETGATHTGSKAGAPSHVTAGSGPPAHAAGKVEAKEATNTAEFTPPSTSTLSEENALLQRAMVASRNGDDRSAIAILDTLLGRFPHSILKENAHVERSRALRRLEQRDATEP